jgi:hypothetical protein
MARIPLASDDVTLAEWIDEYRRVDPDDFTRPRVDAVDDWEEEPLIASQDRVADTRPRWMDRARSIGYGPLGWR